jgi:hypothetical protein
MSQNTKIADWKLSASFVNAKNNYSYINFISKEKLRTNNDARTFSIYGSSIFKINHSSLQIIENFYNGAVHTPGTETSIITGNQKDLYNCINLLYQNPEIFNSLADLTAQISYKYDRTFFDENCSDNNESDISLHKLHTVAANLRSSFFINTEWTLNCSGDITINLLNSTNCYNNSDLIFKNLYGLSLSSDYTGTILNFYPSCKIVFTDSEIIPVPKLGIKFNKLNLSTNIYRMFTTPTMNQLYWKNTSYAQGNPNLKNESGWGIDANYTYKKNTLELTCGIFSMYYKDKIQWLQINQNKFQCQNTASAAYFGGNIFVNYSLFNWLSIHVKYDLNLSYLLTNGLTLKDNKRIMYTPVNIFYFDTDWHYKKYTLTCSYTFTGKRFKSNDNATYLPAYNIFDIVFEYKLQKNTLLYIVLKNIFNEHYSEIDGYPMPGFSCKTGVKISI